MGKLKGRAVKPRLQPARSRLAGAPVGERQRSQQRDAVHSWRAWYKTARWQKLRLQVLKRDGWTCQQTGELLVGKYPALNSPVVDHLKPHRGDPDLFWDPDNLQTVSKRYHDGEKQSMEKRGLV
ncbi:HNH endonuclease [Leisingera daeponensis]|uniref:HNH endonuclease n=1 Tax=Leisingera daeponensis TaxID=405746 RepID=A0ABS7NBG1_9RHOB|nr:HNH endonuclease [Leisingera daeponensis]MBY6138538.1 HNH endonuclease [Leisingera daeponensis]